MIARRSIRLLAVLAGVALVGCAPVTFAPGTPLGLSVGPRLQMSLSSCPGLGSRATRMGITSSAVELGSLRNQVAEIQNRYSAGSSWIRRDMRSWKKAATGDC